MDACTKTVETDTKTYIFHESPTLSFQKAEIYCQENDNGTLAIIKDQETLRHLVENAPTRSQSSCAQGYYTLGLKKGGPDKPFKWSDGSLFENEARNIGRDFSSGTCSVVGLYPGKGDIAKAQFVAFSCTNNLAFLCEKERRNVNSSTMRPNETKTPKKRNFNSSTMRPNETKAPKNRNFFATSSRNLLTKHNFPSKATTPMIAISTSANSSVANEGVQSTPLGFVAGVITAVLILLFVFAFGCLLMRRKKMKHQGAAVYEAAMGMPYACTVAKQPTERNATLSSHHYATINESPVLEDSNGYLCANAPPRYVNIASPGSLGSPYSFADQENMSSPEFGDQQSYSVSAEQHYENSSVLDAYYMVMSSHLDDRTSM